MSTYGFALGVADGGIHCPANQRTLINSGVPGINKAGKYFV
jgi:hypothetical protein